GWTVIGSYGDVWDSSAAVPGQGVKANTVAINPTNITSSYWLIGAYNTAFGGALTAGNDYVKLLAVYGATGAIVAAPEPSSVILMAVALLTLTFLRRRAII